MRVRLPPAADIWSTVVGGAAVKPARDRTTSEVSPAGEGGADRRGTAMMLMSWCTQVMIPLKKCSGETGSKDSFTVRRLSRVLQFRASFSFITFVASPTRTPPHMHVHAHISIMTRVDSQQFSFPCIDEGGDRLGGRLRSPTYIWRHSNDSPRGLLPALRKGICCCPPFQR